MNLETLTLREQIDGLKEKKFSSVELVENYISIIEDKEDLNIFVSNDFEKYDRTISHDHSNILICPYPLLFKNTNLPLI